MIACIIIQIIIIVMSSRPVLSMNFYQAAPGAYSNPYTEMVQSAKQEK